MKLVCAYFGHDPRTAPRDLHDIKQLGFDIVNFPMSEEHLSFQAARYGELCEVARKEGLESWISPWGVLGVFGGEGITAHKVCPKSCTATRLMRRWVDAAGRADAIHWDEPRDTCCSIEPTFREWSLYASRQGIPQSTYYNLQFGHIPQEPVGTTVFIDLYTEHNERLAFYEAAKQFLPYKIGAWVQGFHVFHDGPLEILQRALESNLDYVGIWGYNGCQQISTLASDPCYWQKVERILRERL